MASTTELVTESVTNLASEKMEQEEEEKTFKTMSMEDRYKYVKEVITIEPLLSSYVMAATICGPALNSLEFEKSCTSDLNYNDTICNAILTGTYQEQNFTTENDAVQQLIIEMHSWQQPLQSFMPIILILFLGSYSDRHKIRKPFLVIPIFGEFFAVVGCILCVIFMKQWPLVVQGILQTVIPSFFGGPTMIIMACFAYIADVSTLEMRTLRIGVVQIMLNVCSPIAQLLGGVLFASIGYIGVLVFAGILYMLGFLYGLFWIKEPKKAVGIDNKKNLIKDIFDVGHAIETLKLVIKKTDGNSRLGIMLIMMLLFIYAGVVGGEGTVFFLFTQSVYQWTVVQFSYFLTINTVIHLVGSIIALPLFTTVLHLSDLTITAISFFDKILSNIIFIIFVTPTGLYTGTVVSLIIGIASIAIRSQATKVVSENDLGKAQSLFAIIEAIAPAVAIPIYNQGIYGLTLESFPQAFFLLGIALYTLGIVVVIWLHFDQKSRNASKEKTETNGTHAQNGKNGSNAIVETTHF